MTARVSLGRWSKISILLVSPKKMKNCLCSFGPVGVIKAFFRIMKCHIPVGERQLFSFCRLTMFVWLLFNHIYKSVSQATSVCRLTWHEAKRFWDNILNLDWFGYVYSSIFIYFFPYIFSIFWYSSILYYRMFWCLWTSLRVCLFGDGPSPWGCTSLRVDFLESGAPWGCTSLVMDLLLDGVASLGVEPLRVYLFGGGPPWGCTSFVTDFLLDGVASSRSPWGCTSLVMDLLLEGVPLWWWTFFWGCTPPKTSLRVVLFGDGFSPAVSGQASPTQRKNIPRQKRDKANRRWIVLLVFCNIVRFLVLGVLCLFLRSLAAMPNMTRRKTQERKAKHLLFWERFESIFVLLSPCRCSPAVQKRSAKNWLDYKQKGAKKRKGGLQALLLLFFACLGSCALSFALQPRRQKKTAPGGFGTHILGTTSQSILLTFLFNKGLVEMVVVKRPACFHRSFVLWWTWQPWTKAKRSEWQTTRLQQASRWQPKTKICLHHAACRGTSAYNTVKHLFHTVEARQATTKNHGESEHLRSSCSTAVWQLRGPAERACASKQTFRNKD